MTVNVIVTLTMRHRGEGPAGGEGTLLGSVTDWGKHGNMTY